MAATFPKSSDRLLRIGGVIFAVTILAAAGLFIYFPCPTVVGAEYSPTQPVPFSHKFTRRRSGSGLLLLALHCAESCVRGCSASIKHVTGGWLLPGSVLEKSDGPFRRCFGGCVRVSTQRARCSRCSQSRFLGTTTRSHLQAPKATFTECAQVPHAA